VGGTCIALQCIILLYCIVLSCIVLYSAVSFSMPGARRVDRVDARSGTGSACSM
jgi:hypothetical protein